MFGVQGSGVNYWILSIEWPIPLSDISPFILNNTHNTPIQNWFFCLQLFDSQYSILNILTLHPYIPKWKIEIVYHLPEFWTVMYTTKISYAAPEYY